ncbi:MAG: PIN domain-containing protein [Pseudomonadota bacterium]
MPGKIFIDTNIIIYSLGPASTKAHLAAPLFVNSPSISTQVLSETANVAHKRLALSLTEIRQLITSLAAMCHVEIISLHTIHIALDIQERYGFSWYDSLIIAAALDAGCDTLYSEDMQNNQEINDQLHIVNPFI